MSESTNTEDQLVGELESLHVSEPTNAKDQLTENLENLHVSESPNARDQLMEELDDLYNDIQPYASTIFIKPEVIEETKKELIAEGMNPEETVDLVQELLRKYQDKNRPKQEYSDEEKKEIERLVKKADELLEKFAQIGEGVSDSVESLVLTSDRER